MTTYFDAMSTMLGDKTFVPSTAPPVPFPTTGTGSPGAYITTGGMDSDGCIRSGTISAYPARNFINVILDLGEPSLVEELSYFHQIILTPSATLLYRSASFYDENGNNLLTDGQIFSNPASGWQQHLVTPNLENVRYIHLYAWGGNATPPPEIRIDNINIVYRFAFTYDRGIAAQAAYGLSLQNPTTHSQLPTLSYYSAMFTSLALYAGGIPMVDVGGAGWKAILDGSQEVIGSSAWNSHNYLPTQGNPTVGGAVIGYIAGSGAVGLPQSHQFHFNYSSSNSSLQVSDIFQSSVIDPTALQSHQNSWADVQKGDYIYINSTQSGTYVPHGFIVVGFGPAIKGDATTLDKVSFNGTSIQFSGTASDMYVQGLSVPYVVDWSTNAQGQTQRQTPRPFYCSRIDEGTSGFSIFNHTEWEFISVPDDGWVDADIHVSRDDAGFYVSSSGQIVVL